MGKKWTEVDIYTGLLKTEDMPTNAAGRGAVAGIGVGPDGEPGVMPKRKIYYDGRKNQRVQRTS